MARRRRKSSTTTTRRRTHLEGRSRVVAGVRSLLTLAAVLVAAAPAGATVRPLHALGPVEAAAKSDAVSTVAWRQPGGPIVVWSAGRTHTVEPPAGACGLLGGPLAVGSGRLLFWCGPDKLWVTTAATGATTAVTPDRDLGGTQVPTSFAVGRSYAYLGWPLDEGAVAVDEDNGHVSPVASGRRIDLDSPALYAKRCARGYELLPGTTKFDAVLAHCGHPAQRRGLIGDAIQLGGGWLTWRPSRSMTSVAALRLRDQRVFRFRLPKLGPGIDWYNAAVGIAHTKDRVFVTDDFTGGLVLRTAPLPR